MLCIVHFMHLCTVPFKNKLECNITIKLEYANVKMNDAHGPCPLCYMISSNFFFLINFLSINTASTAVVDNLFCRAYGSGKEDNPLCYVSGFENSRMKLLRNVSFVDCPVDEGHDILMERQLWMVHYFS